MTSFEFDCRFIVRSDLICCCISLPARLVADGDVGFSKSRPYVEVTMDLLADSTSAKLAISWELAARLIK